MKSTGTFAEYFSMYMEDMTAGGAVGSSAGGFNPSSNSITSTDSYARGDARIATPNGPIQKRSGAVKTNRKKRKVKHDQLGPLDNKI